MERLRALATLPERERVALIRTIVDGDAATDVADDLGVTPNRVYQLVQHGSARPGGAPHDLAAGRDPRGRASHRA